MDEEIEVGRTRAILLGDEVVGAVAVRPEHAGQVERAMEAAGFAVEDTDDGPTPDLPEPTGQRIDLDGGECTVEEHLPCDIKTGISVAADVARDLGLPSAATLSAIRERGYTSVDEARHVLQAWSQEVQSAPGADEDQIGWAEVVVSEVFGREPETVPQEVAKDG